MPGDPPPKPTPLVLALAADPTIELRLARFAIRRMPSAVEGEDAAAHAIELVLKRERETFCWNPKGPWSFQKYMFRTVRGVVSTRRRAAENDPHDSTEDERLEALVGSTDDTESDSAERRELDALADQTERLLAEDSQGAIPLAMLKAAIDHDCDDHAEFARIIGCSVQDIRRGQRIITKYAAKLVEAFRAKKRRPTL
jgi:hypothetical protein